MDFDLGNRIAVKLVLKDDFDLQLEEPLRGRISMRRVTPP